MASYVLRNMGNNVLILAKRLDSFSYFNGVMWAYLYFRQTFSGVGIKVVKYMRNRPIASFVDVVITPTDASQDCVHI